MSYAPAAQPNMPSLTAVRPSWSALLEYHQTCGPEVAEIAGLAGFDPDAELRMVLDQVFAFDRHGDLLICDIRNHRIRRLNVQTGIIDTYAGTGDVTRTGKSSVTVPRARSLRLSSHFHHLSVPALIPCFAATASAVSLPRSHSATICR